MDRRLDVPRLDELAAAYFDPTGPFAADSSDQFQPGDRNRITAADLLAVTFLDVAVPPLGVRQITEHLADGTKQRLTDTRHDLDLWRADDVNLKPAEDLWKVVADIEPSAQSRPARSWPESGPACSPSSTRSSSTRRN